MLVFRGVNVDSSRTFSGKFHRSYFTTIDGLYKWVSGVISVLLGVITPFITGRGPCFGHIIRNCGGLPVSCRD